MKIAVLMLLAVSCRPAQKSTADAAPPEPVATVDSSTTPANALDATLAKKAGENANVTFIGADSVKVGSVVVAVVIDNTSDQELPISAPLSLQATDISGISGTLNMDHLNLCSGMAPPHGRFACQAVYTFPSTPKELRLRVEGAWFHVAVGTGNDAGAKK